MQIRGMRRVVTVAGLTAAAVGATTAAVAANGRTAGAVTAVAVVAGSQGEETSSPTYVDLPGAVTTITVPSGQRGLVIAGFTGASQCAEVNADDDSCLVRILVGGVEAAPAGAEIFDTAACCTSSSSGDAVEAHAIERSRGPLNAGTYPVKVQWRTDGQTQFSLGGWRLTVERAKVG